jgi:hypothetical protein
MRNRDPVHFHKDAWWFWNDRWTRRMGPFKTKEELALELRRYCLEELKLTKEEVGIKDKELEA